MLNVRSFNDLNRTVAVNLHKLDRNQFDVIVGIPRSGMLPATLLATHLQLPLTDVESFRAGLLWGRSGVKLHAKPGVRVLLVDDSCNKGRAMQRAVELIRPRAGLITRFAVYGPYQVEHPEELVDIAFETVRGPRVFQWNLWKHKRMERWGFDFDGVLCRDPTNHENDDGPRYIEFLRNAEPMHLPSRPLGAIITGRLEKYREQTEEWLLRRNVVYRRLVMCPYATKAERMARGGRGQWKAEVMSELGLEFFIESNPKQARIIASRAGRPVWCTETQECYQGVEP